MSLLNDMLRDLSHQQTSMKTAAAANQAALEFNAQEQRDLFYNTNAAKPLPRTLIPSVIVFVVVLALLAVYKLHFSAQADGSATANQQLVDQMLVDQPLAASTPAREIESITLDPSSLPVTPALASVTESVDSYAIAPQLGEQIAALESAITNLSSLVASANNQTVNPLATVEMVTAEIAPVAAAIPAEDMNSSSATDVVESVSIQEPFVPTVAEQVTDSLVPLPEEPEPRFSIAPNSQWMDQQQSARANQLVAQGQADVAIESLQGFIDTAEQPRESLKTLLDIFAAQEKTEAMQGLLTQGNFLSVVEQAFYAAKIASIKNDDAQAIQLLETHLGAVEGNENYRALLAGLYQRSGMYVEAASHYRRLLAVFGDKSAYWLGFALAQDALNQAQVAVQAFQRVDQYADLPPQVRTYVQQRIAALQQ